MDLYKHRKCLYKKQKGKCFLCCKDMLSRYSGTIHHKKARKDGGDDNIENLSLVHVLCHKKFHGIQQNEK